MNLNTNNVIIIKSANKQTNQQPQYNAEYVNESLVENYVKCLKFR